MTDNIKYSDIERSSHADIAGNSSSTKSLEHCPAYIHLFARVFNWLHSDIELKRDVNTNSWRLAGPNFCLCIHNSFIKNALYSFFSRNPHEIIADGFVEGDWYILEGHLDDVLAHFWNKQLNSSGILQLSRRMLDNPRFRKSQLNSPSLSKENIKRHYDNQNPDNILFEQMLGKVACYSSAIYDNVNQSLEEAQENKLDLICRSIQPHEAMRVLDIGSGWGELSARLFDSGCNVTGITVSHNQLTYCQDRFSEQIKSGRLNFKFSDYRDFFDNNDEKFHAVSCIEVLDHIGLAHFDSFFRSASENLLDDGLFFLQVITRPRPGQTSSWIDKHIYPGGYIASMEEIEAAYANAGFKCVQRNDFSGEHYARTLHEWRALLAEFRKMQTDEKVFSAKFFRKWEMFLASSILAFEEMGFANSHIALVKSKK